VPAAGSPTLVPADSARLALLDSRFKLVTDDYTRRGSPKAMIDSFTDLIPEEMAVLYDRAVMWKKQRKPKDNPYRRPT
jgi:hypothetical protein